jgi:hypothetical protein
MLSFWGAAYSKKTCGLGKLAGKKLAKKFHKSKRPNLTKMPVKLTKIMKGTV